MVITNAHLTDIRCLEALNNGGFASGSTDYKIRVWTSKKKLDRKLYSLNEGNLLSMKCGPDDILITGSTNGSIKIWDLCTGVVLKRFQENDWISSIIIFSSGIFGCAVGDNIKFFSIEKEKSNLPVCSIPKEVTGGIRSLELFDSNRMIGYDVGTIKIFDLNGDQEEPELAT